MGKTCKDKQIVFVEVLNILNLKRIDQKISNGKVRRELSGLFDVMIIIRIYVKALRKFQKIRKEILCIIFVQ